MKIYLNDILVELPDGVTNVSELVKWKNLPDSSTAVAIDDMIVRKGNWEIKKLEPMCHVTVISAAFGG